ncbi:MAG TPA: hypothetical protein VFH27_11705 [Longimicrobiaceae bacterium]|nr:hypothetical protein [Longimicrobiaceae bacterium]
MAPVRTAHVQLRGPDVDNAKYTFAITSEDRVVSRYVHAPLDRAWQAIGQAYQTLGLPINELDEQHHVIASTPAPRAGRVAGEPLSAALDCGVNAARAPIVNAYAVAMTISTRLTAAGDSTLVETLVRARAQDSVHNNPSVSCGSLGRLEKRIADNVVGRTMP